ncbi:MAG: hypothetical protein R6V06_04105 [Kiritimatiellia bacterium]
MKLKKSSLEGAHEESQQSGGAYISKRLRNPNEEETASTAVNETVYGIAAIAATLAMFAVMVILYLNLQAFANSGLFVQ